MTRLAVFSDIHADIRSLKRAYSICQKHKVQRIYHAGDIVGYGENPNEVIDFLREHDIEGVLGNFDEAVAFDLPSCGCYTKTPQDKAKVVSALKAAKKMTSENNKRWLRQMSDEYRFEVSGRRVLIIHATVFAIAQYVFQTELDETFQTIADESDADIVLCGHTHMPYKKKVGKVTIVNAGSISIPRQSQPRKSFAVVDFSNRLPRSKITYFK